MGRLAQKPANSREIRAQRAIQARSLRTPGLHGGESGIRTHGTFRYTADDLVEEGLLLRVMALVLGHEAPFRDLRGRGRSLGGSASGGSVLIAPRDPILGSAPVE